MRSRWRRVGCGARIGSSGQSRAGQASSSRSQSSDVGAGACSRERGCDNALERPVHRLC
jgi:hypothetical protein